MPRIKHFVKGRKDGEMRPVQHIPIDANDKQTPALRLVGSKAEIQPNHVVMLLGDPATAVRAVIAKARIITVVEEAAGLPT